MVDMNGIIKIFLCVLIYNVCAAPVRKPEEKPDENTYFNNLHYKNYLEQIVKELENDKLFAEKVKEAQAHNRTEHIAGSLQFVNHKIRNKLDEIKRQEIERLNILENELERRKLEKQGVKVPPPSGKFEKTIVIDKMHLDHNNVHSFEMSDLEKLIKKAEADLMNVDKAQDQQFKEHEMKKEYLKKKKLESIKDEEERKKVEESFKASEVRHKNHSKIHHPGNEEQLKEVWNKNDHLDPAEFNPKAFFDLHDMNGDGHLDINEVESLMQNELSKVYEPNNSDDDMQQKYHEMMRMRMEMMQAMDLNKDNVVSKQEFLKYTATENFKDDSEWLTQEEDNRKPYSDKEYKDFEDDYGHNEDDDDDFSDLDETLRYIPKEMHVPVKPDSASIPIKPIEKDENQRIDSPPIKMDNKADIKDGAPKNL